MPAAKPTRPPAARVLATPKVDDPQVARAFADVTAAVHEEQRDARLPRVLEPGDILIVGRAGTIVRLAAGTPGQTLTIGADGLPEWS